MTRRKMWSLPLLLAVTCVAGYTIEEKDDAPKGVTWPSEYFFQGVTFDVFAGKKEIFKIWYSAKLNRARINYYNGLDSTYYYGETKNKRAVAYRVFPITSKNLDVSMKCSSQMFFGNVRDFLLKVRNLEYSGDTTYRNKTVEIWESHTRDSYGTRSRILYVDRSSSNDFDLPVRYELKSFNEWTKALNSHKIIEYYNFQEPNSYYMDVENVEACKNSKSIALEDVLKFHGPDVSSGLDEAFHAYKYHHRRQYDEEEHEMRKRIFEMNWREVIAHNNKNLSYKMEINQFSDRTPEELRYLSGTFSNPLARGSVDFPHSEEELATMVEDLPENFNMRLDGIISSVKNQDACGSCWAFATTAAVEGVLAKSNGGRNLDLSEQSLVDCSWGFSNHGCDGGLLDTSLKYVMEYGIPTERQYGEYLAKNGRCEIRNMTKVYKIKGFARVPPLSVNAMKVALYKYGPVMIAIHASDALMQYSSGIFYDPECTGLKNLNHAVTVVGYGLRDGTLYWIVKNSWGEGWGQDGYVLMSATNNNCFALTEAFYPIV